MAPNVEDVVHSLLVEDFRIDESTIAPERTFKELGLDSLDVVSFVMALEDRLGVEIPEKELEGVERLDQALELLGRKVGSSA